jgi:acyl dehydratase
MTDYNYFEDFAAGDMYETSPVDITKAEIIAFAERYDPQPMHLTGENLIASGWQTAALTMRLFVTCEKVGPPPGAIGLGVQELSWLHLVRPGDFLHLKIEVLALRTSGSRPGNGIVTYRFPDVQSTRRIGAKYGKQHVATLPSGVISACGLKLEASRTPYLSKGVDVPILWHQTTKDEEESMNSEILVETGAPEIPSDIAAILLHPASYTDDDIIYPAFKWLRENMPLAVARVPGYDPIWLVTKHADLMEVERNAELFHNADSNPILNKQVDDAYLRSINGGSLRVLSSLTFMDPPEHGRVCGITANWFLPANIRKLEADIRKIAKRTVAHFLSFDGECDFLGDFALHYPLRVIMTMFGVPQEDEPRMLKLTQEFSACMMKRSSVMR